MTPEAYLKLIMRVLGCRERTAREMQCYKQFCRDFNVEEGRNQC